MSRAPMRMPEHLDHLSRDELIQLWRRGEERTERDLANIEAAIWIKTPESERKTSSNPRAGSSLVLSKLLGGVPARFERRQLLYNLGVFGDPLWERIERDRMPLSVAISIFRDAKKVSNGKAAAFAQAIQNRLRAYDMVDAADAQTELGVVRRKKVSRLRTTEEVQERGWKNGSVKKAKNLVGKSFFSAARDFFSTYVNEQLSDCDPTDADQFRRELGADLNIFLDEFQNRIRFMKIRAKSVDGFQISSSQVSRRRVLDACAVLIVNPPKPNMPVDLVHAKKRMKARARVLHPDVTRREETRGPFEEVIEAYKVLEQYNECLTSGATRATTNEEQGEKGENHVYERKDEQVGG